VTGRVDRIAAVYRFVERNIKYLGIEFGIGAYRPRPAESTLAQGQGDCKDMTALMVALLKALDIKAYPALVRPSDQGIFVTDHPSPGQFSHVLLFVPHSRGDFWLDPTAGLGTLGAIPKILRGQLALVVDGQGGRLLRIPVATASEHELNETRVFTLNQTGGGQVDTQIALTGDLAGRSRQKLLGVDPAVRGAFLSAPGYLFGRGFIPASVELKDLDTPSEPLGISASLKDNDLVAVRLDGSLVFAPDLDILTNGLVSAPGGGVTVESPRTIIRKLIIKPPSGYRFNWSPLSIRYRGPIELYVDEKREADQTIITTRLSFSVRPTTRPELRQLKQAFAMVRQALSQHLTILPRPDLDRVKFLAAIVAERPNDPELLVHLSRALMSTQKYRAALVVLKQAERLKPNMPIVWAMMAAAHVQVGQFELAEKRLRQVIESGQAVARLHLALATLLKEQHRFADSIAVLVDAQKAFPQNAEIQKELVLAFDRNGQLGRAAEEGRRLAQAYPHDLEVQKLWGRIALAKGEFLDAETAFRLVLSVEPNDKDALNDLAWLLRDDPQRRVEAISLARRAIAIDPSLANTWDTLAEIYFLDGQMENALQAIDHAMELEPDMDRPFQKRRTKILRTFKSDDAPTTR